MSKQSLAEILADQLEQIDEIGGPERHLLAQTIGRDAYDALVTKAKGANLLARWIAATGKAKAPATKALALQIARVADKPELVKRIEREIGDAFDDGSDAQEVKLINTAQLSSSARTDSAWLTKSPKERQRACWPNSLRAMTSAVTSRSGKQKGNPDERSQSQRCTISLQAAPDHSRKGLAFSRSDGGTRCEGRR